MSNRIFDSNASYVERFVTNQSKRIKLPTFKYLDAKLHPLYKDHIVVLSSNQFPEDCKMTYCWDDPFYSIDNIHADHLDSFKDAYDRVVKEREQHNKEDVKAKKSSKHKDVMDSKSPALKQTDALLEETKGLGLDSEDSDDYEGGEGDYEKPQNDKDTDLKKDEENKSGTKLKGSDSITNLEKEVSDVIDKNSQENGTPKNTNENNKTTKEVDQNVDGKSQESKNDQEEDVVEEASKLLDENFMEENGKDEEEKGEKKVDDGKEDNPASPRETSSLANKDDNTVAAKDEEEETQEVENKTPEEPPKSESDIFLNKLTKLSKEDQQKVFDYAVDKILDARTDIKFNYHGYAKQKPDGPENPYARLNEKDFSIPENEKLDTTEHTYAPSEYYSVNTKKKFQELEYKPAIIREKFQISLWRVDDFGLVKTKDRYFTPNSKRFEDPDFTGFSIQNSLDNENIVLVENGTETLDEALVIILDAFDLKVVSELTVTTNNPDYDIEEINDDDSYYSNYDDYFDEFDSSHPTSFSAPSVIVWNKGRYCMSNVSIPDMCVHYYMNIYNTQHKQVVKMLERTGELDKNMIVRYQSDPKDPDVLYITVITIDKEVKVVKVNMMSGAQTVEAKAKSQLFRPEFKVVFNKAIQPILKEQRVRMEDYQPDSIDDQKFVPFYHSLEKKIEEMNGNSRTGINSEYISSCIANEMGYKEIGVAKDQAIITLSPLVGEEFKVNYIPLDTKISSKKFVGEEILYIKFVYPAVLLVKGCNEVLIYSITEDMYYYHKLNSPIILETSTVYSPYAPEVKGYIDLGPYIAYTAITYNIGSSPYISASTYKRYIEKENLPKQKLLCGFDMIKTLFISKEEDAFMLQFTNAIVCSGSCTNGLFQVVESDYEKGELMQITCDGYYSWK